MSEQNAAPITPPTGAGETPKDDALRLPDDHPLVTAYARQKAENESLKEKARRLDQIEEAQKTAEEKAAAREAEALARAEQAEARAIRREVALEHELNKADAALLDAVTDEDAMRNLAKRLASDAKRNGGNYVPNEGNSQSRNTPDETRTFLRQLTGRE